MTTRTAEIRKQIEGLESLIAHERDMAARSMYERKLASLKNDLTTAEPDRKLGESIHEIVKAAVGQFNGRTASLDDMREIIGAEARTHLAKAGWQSPKDAKRTNDFAAAMGKVRTSIIRELGLRPSVSDTEFINAVVSAARQQKSASKNYFSDTAHRGGKVHAGLRPITDILDVALHQQDTAADAAFGPDSKGEYWKFTHGEAKVEKRYGYPDRVIGITVGLEKLAS